MALEIIVLAAGMGKRMHSELPKVLHCVAHSPMLFHVINTSYDLGASKIHVVLGHKHEQVEDALMNGFKGATFNATLSDAVKQKIVFAHQKEQLGTAHAVMQALDNLDADSNVIVLYGDTPLTPKYELEKLISELNKSDMAILTSEPKNPFGYGRIIRKDNGSVQSIIEEKDATYEQKQIREVNTGMIAISSVNLKKYLKEINNENAAKEYYLTDLVSVLDTHNLTVHAVKAQDSDILEGVNNKVQLAFVERMFQKIKAKQLMADGLCLIDPDRFDIRGNLVFGYDCIVEPNVTFEGNVKLGNNVYIGTGSVIKDTVIGDNSIISPYTIIEKSELKQHNTIGPFARLRPGNILEDEVHVGNFVEVKNSNIGNGTKAGHLTYIGDSDVGSDVNFGAGTITCNYDGANKHRTIIEDNVFIGSDTQLIAPVKVEEGSTIGAGSTVTRTVPQNALYITRPQPRFIENYKRPSKIKK